MRRRSSYLAVLSLLACPPLIALVTISCSGDDSTGENPDASTPADGSTPPTDGTTPDAPSNKDTGSQSDAPVSTDAPVADAPGPDEGPPDAADSGAGCAPVTATPVQISGSITTDTTWTCDKLYQVNGIVQVIAPSDGGPPPVLTIQPGTTVLMSNDPNNNGNLLIAPGARLEAVGNAIQPIVFTSSALNSGAVPAIGDWGCVALTGLAPGNWGAGGPDGGAQMSGSPDDANNFPSNFPFPYTAGSDDPSHNTDSSGTLKYVRMEYGGAVKVNLEVGVDGSSATESDHEMLGMYGVGSGTLLDYVDMRQSKFGCLFAQGGQFRARHVICQYGGESGGFDFTRGNQSQVQFVVVQENPNKSSEGIGYKGPSAAEQLPPLTSPTVYNVTTCGTFGGSDGKDPYAFFMIRSPAGVLANFIGTGYYGGLQMDKGGIVATTQMVSSILFGNFDPVTPDAGTNIYDPGTAAADTDLVTWFTTLADGGTSTNAQTDPGISQCANANAFKMAPATALTANAATPPAGADGGADFFDTSATYIGAFKDVNDAWATGAWVVWSDH
ncbi:MAG TPA: hypothetical protein VGI39_08805 [Polyangiaceae bacterium]